MFMDNAEKTACPQEASENILDRLAYIWYNYHYKGELIYDRNKRQTVVRELL